MAAAYLEKLVAMCRRGVASREERRDMDRLLRYCMEARLEVIRQSRADWLAGNQSPGVAVTLQPRRKNSLWTVPVS